MRRREMTSELGRGLGLGRGVDVKLFGGEDSWARIVVVADRRVGLRALIVVDSVALGPAYGGIRRRRYAGGEGEALAEAKRLAEAMTLKCALSGLPAGGAKTVILDHPRLDRRAAYEVLGQAIDELGGRYVCGPDLGTGPEDVAAVRTATRYVNPEGNDAGASTAAGVLSGLRGLLEVSFGGPELGRRRYLIQGLGAVGYAVARSLREAEAKVFGCDPDPDAQARAAALGVKIIDPGAVMSTACDVFMPCALGGSLDVATCAEAPWRAICGSANNQLATPESGRILHARKIAWAPDFVVSAGAVIEGVRTFMGGQTPEVRALIEEDTARIRDTTRSLLEQAWSLDRPIGELARKRAYAFVDGSI